MCCTYMYTHIVWIYTHIIYTSIYMQTINSEEVVSWHIWSITIGNTSFQTVLVTGVLSFRNFQIWGYLPKYNEVLWSETYIEVQDSFMFIHNLK